MTQTMPFRIMIALSALMGAAGVVLAALAAHGPGPALLLPASSMLLFHAPAVIAALLLVERGLAQRQTGIAAALGLLVGAILFSGDLALMQFAGRHLFPMAAPTGGTLMIVSWLVLAVAALLPRRVTPG